MSASGQIRPWGSIGVNGSLSLDSLRARWIAVTEESGQKETEPEAATRPMNSDGDSAQQFIHARRLDPAQPPARSGMGHLEPQGSPKSGR